MKKSARGVFGLLQAAQRRDVLLLQGADQHIAVQQGHSSRVWRRISAQGTRILTVCRATAARNSSGGSGRADVPAPWLGRQQTELGIGSLSEAWLSVLGASLTHLSILTVAGIRALRANSHFNDDERTASIPERTAGGRPPGRTAAGYLLLAFEFQVVGALPDGGRLPQAVATQHPDLVVLDITLPDASGIVLARELVKMTPPPGIVMLTVHADPDFAREAFAAGAMGYVVKSRLASDLVPALHAALARQRFISPCLDLAEVAGASLGS